MLYAAVTTPPAATFSVPLPTLPTYQFVEVIPPRSTAGHCHGACRIRFFADIGTFSATTENYPSIFDIQRAGAPMAHKQTV